VQRLIDWLICLLAVIVIAYLNLADRMGLGDVADQWLADHRDDTRLIHDAD
jgi:hypothetical protein